MKGKARKAPHKALAKPVQPPDKGRLHLAGAGEGQALRQTCAPALRDSRMVWIEDAIAKCRAALVAAGCSAETIANIAGELHVIRGVAAVAFTYSGPRPTAAQWPLFEAIALGKAYREAYGSETAEEAHLCALWEAKASPYVDAYQQQQQSRKAGGNATAASHAAKGEATRAKVLAAFNRLPTNEQGRGAAKRVSQATGLPLSTVRAHLPPERERLKLPGS